MLKNFFQEFPKNFTYYASQCSYYACIMLLSCQQFLAKFNVMTALLEYFTKDDCSIREYRSKELRAMRLMLFCGLNISLTALLESIELI